MENLKNEHKNIYIDLLIHKYEELFDKGLLFKNENENLEQIITIFGRLITAYLDACNVDIFILCLNDYLEIETLNSYISQIKKYTIFGILII